MRARASCLNACSCSLLGVLVCGCFIHPPCNLLCSYHGWIVRERGTSFFINFERENSTERVCENHIALGTICMHGKQSWTVHYLSVGSNMTAIWKLAHL